VAASSILSFFPPHYIACSGGTYDHVLAISRRRFVPLTYNHYSRVIEIKRPKRDSRIHNLQSSVSAYNIFQTKKVREPEKLLFLSARDICDWMELASAASPPPLV
jgi:hypothetical protein